MSTAERLSLHGRKALVTGASKGIGLETCRTLAEAGADVVAVARDAAGLKAAAEMVQAAGRHALTLTADLADAAACERTAREAVERWGTIDVLVNNAGTSSPASLVDQSVEDWDRILAVNLRAPWLFARVLAPGMMAQRRGKIVNVSSQTSNVALVDHGAYAASKNGLNALTKVMTVEWAPHNIQANAVCPTVVMTPMGEQVWSDPAKLGPFVARIPAGRVARTQEVCDLILFLASDASDMINGQEIFLDGGYTAL
ncbi:MAG: SDR family oxidoreductase [Parafilimonas terrae]|nr:SDR family oxidoreductase [Parafilimonas terrae]